MYYELCIMSVVYYVDWKSSSPENTIIEIMKVILTHVYNDSMVKVYSHIINLRALFWIVLNKDELLFTHVYTIKIIMVVSWEVY